MKTGTVLLGCKRGIGASGKPSTNDIQMIGRRWRDSKGNTYHTVTVLTADGRYIGDSPITYGYGRQFIQTGKELLKRRGFKGKNYNITDVAIDVKHKKDL